MTPQELRQRFEYDPSKKMEGGFSEVYIALDKSYFPNRKVALKFFNKYAEYEKYDLRSEINRTKGLDHPNIGYYEEILEVIDVDGIHQKTRIAYVLVLEYYDAGDVSEFINDKRQEREFSINNLGTSLEQAQIIFEQSLDLILEGILKGLYYLKTKNIIHRDIKPNNLLVTYVKRNNNDNSIRDNISREYAQRILSGEQHLLEGEFIEPLVKIIDFGISKNKDSDGLKSSKIIGTLPYMAPEQIAEEEFGDNGEIDYRVDIWSFGLVAFELITGSKLFTGIESQTDEVKRNRILTEDITQRLDEVPKKYYELIKSCLVRKVADRKSDHKFSIKNENLEQISIEKENGLVEKIEALQGKENNLIISNIDDINRMATLPFKKENKDVSHIPEREEFLEIDKIKKQKNETKFNWDKFEDKYNFFVLTFTILFLIFLITFIFKSCKNEFTDTPSSSANGLQVPLKNSKLLASVQDSDGQWKCIDTNGKIVNTKNNYSYIGEFSGGLAVVELKKKFGYIDASTNIVIDAKYDNSKQFTEGLAPVCKGKKWGYINIFDSLVVPYKFEFADVFYNGMARVELNGNKGYLRKEDLKFIPLKFKVDYQEFYSDGICRCPNGKIVKNIDKNGDELFPELDTFNIGYFSEGLAPFNIENKSGYVDKKGNLYPLKFNYCGDFVNGLARVDMADPNNIFGLTGFINKNFEIVIPCKYELSSSYRFSDGLYPVYDTLNRQGFIDTYGTLVIQYSNRYISDFKNGFAKFFLYGKDNRVNFEKQGLINKDGSVIFPMTKYVHDFGLANNIEWLRNN